MELIKITNDLFDVASRLKSVKQTYVLYYYPQKGRYEVHDTAQHNGTFSFAVPFEELDARTVDYARKTSVKNAEKIFAEIEANNEAVKKRALEKQIELSTENYFKRRYYERCRSGGNGR